MWPDSFIKPNGIKIVAQIHWNPKLAEHEIMGRAMDRLEEAAKAMASVVKDATPEGSVTRPMYKTGPYAGKYWTARDAGSLKRSVRTARKEGSTARNVRIIVGHRKAYYGKIIEFGINGNQHQGFFRKSINRGKRIAKNILMGK